MLLKCELLGREREREREQDLSVCAFDFIQGSVFPLSKDRLMNLFKGSHVVGYR